MTDEPSTANHSLLGDERAVSTTLAYTLTLSISAVLVAGLLIAGGGLIEDQQQAITADELTVSGQQLAGGLEDADRLAGAAENGTVEVDVWLPADVGAGGEYRLRLVNHPTPSDQPARGTVVVSADSVDVTRNVSFRTEYPIANATLPGGPVTVVVADDDGDGDRELVVSEGGETP